MEQFSHNKGSFPQTGTHNSQYTGGTQAVTIQQQYDQSRSGATFSQQNGGTGARGFVSSSVGGGGLASGGGQEYGHSVSASVSSSTPHALLVQALGWCLRWNRAALLLQCSCASLCRCFSLALARSLPHSVPSILVSSSGGGTQRLKEQKEPLEISLCPPPPLTRSLCHSRPGSLAD